jgi:hypothetical protein
MTGVALSCGIPFSPWQAAHSCAFSSIVWARAGAGSHVVARTAMIAQGRRSAVRALRRRGRPGPYEERRSAIWCSGSYRRYSFRSDDCRCIDGDQKRRGQAAPSANIYGRRGLLRRIQSNVNAMMVLPRLKSSWTLPPAPTTTYCLPPTVYVEGGALTPAPA